MSNCAACNSTYEYCFELWSPKQMAPKRKCCPDCSHHTCGERSENPTVGACIRERGHYFYTFKAPLPGKIIQTSQHFDGACSWLSRADEDERHRRRNEPSMKLGEPWSAGTTLADLEAWLKANPGCELQFTLNSVGYYVSVFQQGQRSVDHYCAPTFEQAWKVLTSHEIWHK